MLTRICLGLLLIASAPLWCQVNASAPESGTTAGTDSDSRMFTPAPVSGESYSAETASEARSNYLSGGISFTSAYMDNALATANGHEISDVSYSISPMLALDETTGRFHSTLTYSPGFTFYQRDSSFNEADQNLGLGLQYRLSPHVTVSFHDAFHKTSDLFNQPDFALSNPVSGTVQAPSVAVISPIGDVLSNSGNGEITYQFSPHGMIGASGNFSNLHYSSTGEFAGLSDGSSQGGGAFYTYRLSKKHYIGAQYQYGRSLSSLTGTQYDTETHTIFLFYSLYLNPHFSISFSGGPQYSDTMQGSFASQSWSPAAGASFGWQARHTSLSGSYSRLVSGGGGLVGAFHSNSASFSARQLVAKTWSISAGANYSIYQTLTPFFFLANPGGHSISGTVSIQRQFGQHMSFQAGYTRLHQSYGEVAAIATTPDTNRESISISYHFTRPIGR